MGMDVYGKAPTSEEGRYFRNNVWWWRPLAEYIVEKHPAIASGCTRWQSNDGDGLNAEDAVTLADALSADLSCGLVATYEAERTVELAALPRETCTICDGTGTRTDEIGVTLGYAARGTCNGCDGIGDREPWAAAYPFNIENVAEFAKFARASGGFAIC